MEETNRKNEKLIKELKMMGYDFSLMNERMKNYLILINEKCEEVIDKEKEALSSISRSYITVESIAKLSKISRRTFYNQPLLKEYVDYKANEFKKFDNSYKLNCYAEENAELKIKLKKMEIRDIQIMQLKKENEDLKNQIKRYKALLKPLIPIETFRSNSNNSLKLNNVSSIISWNVNGFNARQDQIEELIIKENPSILCLQETRINEPDNFKGYFKYFNSARKSGYSGVAIYSKKEPLLVRTYNTEGRLILAEYDDFILLNVYVPTIGTDHKRLDYRENFDNDLYSLIAQIDKPIIMCGDLNVVPEQIDARNPNNNDPGQTEKEIKTFNEYLSLGFKDAYRDLFPTSKMYTWNDCLRLDYFLIKGCEADDVDKIDYGTSDHSPIRLKLSSNKIISDKKLLS